MLTFSVLSGVACVPVIPLAFELIAEATYPVHQAISSSIVYLWSGIIGSLMIGAELGLDSGISGHATMSQTGWPLCPPEHQKQVRFLQTHNKVCVSCS